MRVCTGLESDESSGETTATGGSEKIDGYDTGVIVGIMLATMVVGGCLQDDGTLTQFSPDLVVVLPAGQARALGF